MAGREVRLSELDVSSEEKLYHTNAGILHEKKISAAKPVYRPEIHDINGFLIVLPET